tara:strand:- start:15504 stop:15686 length:183 start_codon:yes stop_codon:yes gene_type:complete
MKNEWISVNDKLPKKQMVLWYHPEVYNGRTKLSEYYRVDFFDLARRPATYWMPIPAPPKK